MTSGYDEVDEIVDLIVLVLLISNTLMEYYSVKIFCMTLTRENDEDGVGMGMAHAGMG